MKCIDFVSGQYLHTIHKNTKWLVYPHLL